MPKGKKKNKQQGKGGAAQQPLNFEVINLKEQRQQLEQQQQQQQQQQEQAKPEEKKLKLSFKQKRDMGIEKSLQANFFHFLVRSRAVWEFASKMFQFQGRGCVFVKFDNLEESVKPDRFEKVTIVYKNYEEAKLTEYPPIVPFVEKYDIRRMFVVLGAIRTGDNRDSLMQCQVMGKFAEDNYADIKDQYAPFQFKLNSGTIVRLASNKRFCSNSLCEHIEESPNQFKLCGGCQVACYCEKSCQVMHWKMGHKGTCADDKLAREKEKEQCEADKQGDSKVTPATYVPPSLIESIKKQAEALAAPE